MAIRSGDINLVVAEIAKERRSVLILDTCCILDIIRSPIRNNLDSLKAAMRLVSPDDEPTIVLPSLVRDEWADNIASVCDDVRMEIKVIQSKFSSIFKGINYFAPQTPVCPDYFSLGLEKSLRALAERIMDHAIQVVTSDDIHLKANKRVLQRIPPSRPGKDSLKDCVIFEEVLAIGRALKEVSFSPKVVFCSSNKKEFDCEAIDNELVAVDILYTSSLGWAVYEAKG